MLKKKIIFFTAFMFLVTSCGSWDSVKRGLTGQKRQSTDEFLVQKKDPLILPPDFEDLPTPGDREIVKEEFLSFEKKLGEASSVEGISSSTSSTEESILNQIRNK